MRQPGREPEAKPTAPATARSPGVRARQATGSPLSALCITEITSWGVLYYAFPVLAPVITRDTGWSTGAVTAAFSAALVIAALSGIPVGRALDRHGPRGLMTGGSALAVVSVLGIAAAPNLWLFIAAWLVAGVAMAAVLYQPAFAALTRYYAPRHVTALTTLTLVAGLASTVFAPLTSALSSQLSWRCVYLVLALVLAVVTIPLHWSALRRPWPAPFEEATGGPDLDEGRAPSRAAAGEAVRGRSFVLLAAALTLAAFTMSAALINLIPLLTSRGADSGTAALALGLVGVGQVTGRLGYRALVRRLGVRARTVWILALSAAAIAALAVVPGPTALLIAVAFLVGTTRGITTLLQATAVSDRWGTAVYGSLSGILAAPITAATAVAPFAGAALAAGLGGYPPMFLVLTGAVTLAALLATGTTPPTADRR